MNSHLRPSRGPGKPVARGKSGYVSGLLSAGVWPTSLFEIFLSMELLSSSNSVSLTFYYICCTELKKK